MKKRIDRVYSGDIFTCYYNNTYIKITVIKSGIKYVTFSLQQDTQLIIPSKQVYLENFKELVTHYKEEKIKNNILLLI
jgi:hypothetical protein